MVVWVVYLEFRFEGVGNFERVGEFEGKGKFEGIGYMIWTFEGIGSFEGKGTFEGIGSVTERARAQPGRKLSYAASCLVGSQIFPTYVASLAHRSSLCCLDLCNVAFLPMTSFFHKSSSVEMFSSSGLLNLTSPRLALYR